MKVAIIDNPELVEIVQSGLKRNKELYGKRYCPCRLEHTDENICFCQELATTCWIYMSLWNLHKNRSTPYTPVSPYYSTHNANKTNAEI